MAFNAGDAFLSIHPELAANFGRRLASQVQAPVTRAGEEASHHFGRSFARGLKTASIAISVGLAAATVAATRGVLATTKAASDLNETVNKTDVIFGKSAKGIQQWARGSATSFGLSRNEALTNASAFGDMFRQLGIGLPTTTKMSKSMVGLASDLASFSNADISQVLEAQQAAFRGEYDSLQRFIPAINAARVEQVALGQTHKKSAKDLTAAEKAQATYTIMLHDSVRALPALSVLAKDLGPKAGAVITRLAVSFANAIPTSEDLGLGLKALDAAFHGEGITTSSDKFVGKMERLGVTGRKVVDWAKQFGPHLAAIGTSFSKLFQGASQAGPALQQAGGGGHVFANSLIVIGPVLDVVARNIHNIIPWLPAILAGFLAFRAIRTVTGPLVQIGELISNLTAPFRIVALFGQKRALQAHTTALVENTAAMRGNAVSAELSTGATNAGVLASIRARVAVIGQAIAQKAIAVASKAWAAAQWLVNAALSANPIGIVIAAVALLVAGIVIAYKHSETFRRVVDATWRGIRAATASAVTLILRILQGLLNTWLGVAGGILHAAAIAFGWIPGIGGKLKAADRAFGQFKDAVNEKINGIIKKVDVTIRGHDKVKPVIDQIAKEMKARGYSVTARLVRGGTAQKGTRVPGYGGGDRHPYLLEGGETVVPKELTPEIAPWAKARGIPGFQHGGLVRWPGHAWLTGTRNALMSRLADAGGAFTGGAASGNVIRLALAQAKRMAASFKVALALIEAGIVESGLRNLPYGDRDSLGFLQQRPSQGWAHPMNISYAAWDFLRRAIPIQGRYGTAGRLAQAVQRSAFPGRYDQQQARALGILNAYGYDRGGFLPPGRLALNTTGRPEALGFDYDKLGKAVADALRDQPPRVAVDDILAADARMSRRVGGVSRR